MDMNHYQFEDFSDCAFLLTTAVIAVIVMIVGTVSMISLLGAS